MNYISFEKSTVFFFIYIRKQFPTDPEIRDNMEYGIQTVTDSNQVISLSKLSIISQVQTALASYNSCQEKIKDLNKDVCIIQ